MTYKIVYHHRTQGRGGEGHHIKSIVLAMRSLGHSVSVVSPPGSNPLENNDEKPVDKADTSEKGIKAVWRAVSRTCPQWFFEFLEIGYNFYSFKKLYRSIRNGSDFVYERYAFYLWAGAFASRLLKKPFLLEVNEVSGLKRARGQQFLFLTNIIERWIFRQADAIFTVSSKLRDEIIKRGVSPDKVILTPNAIDPGNFLPSREKAKKVRRRYNLEEKCVIGFVGWFDYWDNLETLIERFAVIHSRNPDIAMMLVGDGPMLRQLKERIAFHNLKNDVILTGSVETKNIAAFIGALDICLIPDSNIFGSPIVLFEFMALGKAILARDLPPITDILTHGKNGYLFKSLDHPTFQSHLLELIENDDLRKGLGNDARRTVLENHTWEINTKQILKTYQKVINR